MCQKMATILSDNYINFAVSLSDFRFSIYTLQSLYVMNGDPKNKESCD